MKKVGLALCIIFVMLCGCSAPQAKYKINFTIGDTTEVVLNPKDASEFEAETINGKGEKETAVYTGFPLVDLISSEAEYTTVKAVCVDGFEAVYNREEIEANEIMIVFKKDGKEILDEEEKPTIQILALKDQNMKRCVRMIAEFIAE